MWSWGRAELSDGSCVRSSVFLKKKNKTLHVCSPTGSVAKRCGRTNRSQGQTEEAGRVGCLQHFLRYTGVRGGAGSGRTQAVASTGSW